MAQCSVEPLAGANKHVCSDSKSHCCLTSDLPSQQNEVVNDADPTEVIGSEAHEDGWKLEKLRRRAGAWALTSTCGLVMSMMLHNGNTKKRHFKIMHMCVGTAWK